MALQVNIYVHFKNEVFKRLNPIISVICGYVKLT